MLKLFVADPDPVSGAFLILDPGGRNKDPGSGITFRIRNTGTKFCKEIV
jgi:hypothetical protein